MSRKEGLFDQLKKPTGILGEIAGSVMAATNKEVNRWTIAQMEISPNERILEVGYGPGVALDTLLNVVTHGMVSGVDHSEVMENQARRRNKAAIREGRLNLQVGDVSSLPFEDDSFTKVLVVNAFEYWDDPIAALTEIRRVMAPSANIFIACHPRWFEENEEANAFADEIKAALGESNFHTIRVMRRKLEPILAFCVTGFKH